MIEVDQIFESAPMNRLIVRYPPHFYFLVDVSKLRSGKVFQKVSEVGGCAMKM